MATPPSRQPPLTGSVLTYAPGGLRPGVRLPVSPAPVPAQQTSFLIATSDVSFSVAARQVIIVTFPDLPAHTPNTTDLQKQSSQLVTGPYDELHLMLTLQNVVGAQPSVAPRVIDVGGVARPGYGITGGGVFTTFQAVITGGAQGATGTVLGTVTLMRN